ncbi:MAG TPA: ABC transporter substrate-binding protein [bacterium]|nr:ABC transporter substrate-binding protein [bacterium]
MRIRQRVTRAVGCFAVLVVAVPMTLMSPHPSAGAGTVTLTMARNADMLTWDPYHTGDDPSIFTQMAVYDRLVKLAPSNTSVEPELATSWKISPDGLTATFTLRPGVKFSDGSPLTADDVVLSLTRAIDQKGDWGFLFSPVKSVSKVDDKTVAMHMSEPFAPLLAALSTFAANIYPKALFDKYGEGFGQHPIGTGAFMLDSWQKGAQISLVRNSNYWQPGKPKIDRIVMRVVGDDNTRVLQLQSGQADLIDFVPPNQVQSVRGAGLKIYTVNGTAVLRYTLNETIKPLDEVNVRAALGHAIDRQAVAKNVFFGLATVAKSLLPETTLYYDPNADPLTYDLAKAKAFLAKSSVPSGFTLTVQLPAGNQTYLDTATIWGAGLKQIGVTLKIDRMETTTLIQMRNAEHYTVYNAAWTNDTPDPDELLGVAMDFKSQHAAHTFYNNPEAQRLVALARRELDPKKRQALYTQLQRIESRDAPQIYVVDVPRLYASSPSVIGFAPNSQGKYSFENVSKR